MPKYEHSRDILTAFGDVIVHFLKVIIRCCLEGIGELKKLVFQFVQDLKNAKWTLRIGATIALFLVVIPSVFQWKDNAIGLWHWWNQETITARYAEMIAGNEMQETRKFFDKYHERFMAHDCSWMREVAADRAMYDKWGTTEYKKYSCEEFQKTQAKWWLPYKVNPIIHEGKVVRISGEMVMVFERMTDGTLLMPVKFEIWKEPDWPVWHWTGKPIRIEASIVSE